MIHNTFDPNQTKTDGIAVNQWQVEVGQKREAEDQSKIENRQS